MMSPHVIIVLTVAVTSYSGAQYFLEGNLVIYLPAGPFVWITAGKNKRLITLGDSALPPDHPASLHRSLGVSIQAASLAWMSDERWLVRWGGGAPSKAARKNNTDVFSVPPFLSTLSLFSSFLAPPPPSFSLLPLFFPLRQPSLPNTPRPLKI